MPTPARTQFAGSYLRRLGTVTRLDADVVEICFDRQRCSNCTCSMSGSLQASSETSLALPAEMLADVPGIVVGEAVAVTLPTERFSAATALLFGAPLAVALMFAGVGAALLLPALLQALMVIAGLLAGGCLGWVLTRRQHLLLKTALRNRLRVDRVDC